MDQGTGLFADCADHLGMRVSKQVDRDPGDKVEILLTRFVVNPAPPTAYERDWQAAPGLRVSSKAFGSGRRIPLAKDWRLVR